MHLFILFYKTVAITKIRNTIHTAGIIPFSMYRLNTTLLWYPKAKCRDKIQSLSYIFTYTSSGIVLDTSK